MPILTTMDGIMTVATQLGLRLKTAPNGMSIVREDPDKTRELQALAEMLINASVRFSYINNESIFVRGPNQILNLESDKTLDATKRVIRFCQTELRDVHFVVDYNGGITAPVTLSFTLPLPVEESPQVHPRQLSASQLFDFARDFGLTSKPHFHAMFIQKEWSNPNQVEGFAKMLKTLEEFKIEHTVEKDDYRLCSIRIPYSQQNISQQNIHDFKLN